MPRHLLLRTLSATLLLSLSAPAFASPINPWGVHVGKKVVAVTPFLYADIGPNFYPYLYGQYGVTDRFELLAGVGGGLGDGGTYFEGVEFMPRYFVSDTTGFALHTHFYADAASGIVLAPEYHGIYELGGLTLTINAGWGPTIAAGEFFTGSVYAQVAPEYYFTDSTSVFVELDPDFNLDASEFYMEVVPGVSTAVAETHYFAFGLHVPVTGFAADAMYFGMWYSIAFGGE